MNDTAPRIGPRIGIDGFNLAMSRGTGIATYARVLSRSIAALGHPVDVLYGLPIKPHASTTMREVAFFDRLEQGSRSAPTAVIDGRWWQELHASMRGAAAFTIPMTDLVDRRAFRMPAFDRILNVPDLFSLADRHYRRTRRFLRVRVKTPPAIMHWTYPLPIVVEGARNIYTLHDLVPLRLPHTTLDDKGFYLRLIRGCVAAASRICTVSQTSHDDIVRFFPQAEGKVTNTFEAIDLPNRPPPPPAELAEFLSGVFGLQPRGYFFFFGSIEPKKNVGRLIEAYLASGTTAPLVIVGAQAWKSERELSLTKLQDALKRPGLFGPEPRTGPEIRLIDYLPFETLVMLIRGARAVLFPSLYEGFGLPVVEAMALGTATLASTEGSLPEIAGDAAILVDPYDTRAIADGIRRLDRDDALRARLQEAGPAQAEKFGAGPYRAALASLYASVLAGPG